MPRTFIDEEGLTNVDGNLDAYLDALGLDGEYERVDASSRFDYLVRLRDGAGVVVLTGPEGAPFWQLVSPEVKVRVVPDDYEVQDRVSDLREWAYRAVGCPTAVSGQLLKRKTVLPVGDWRYSYELAARIVLQLLARADANKTCGLLTDLIYEDFPVETWEVDRGCQEMAAPNQFLALDWEWDIETAEPVGLSLAGFDWASYVPLRASDFEYHGDVRRLTGGFSDYLAAGRQGVLHGGRADLASQFQGNPLDLVGRANLDDTMVMAYLAGEPELSLKKLTRKFLGRDPVDFPGNLSSLPVGLATRYAGADARNTYDLFRRLAGILVEREQWGVYNEIERPLVPIVASMERYGVPVSIERVKRAYRDTVAIEQGVRRAILDNYGFDVADDSGKTLETNQARQFVKFATGTDPGTLDQRVLSLLPEGEIDLLLLHRRSRTLRRNFLGRALRYYYAATHPGHEHHLFKARKRFTAKGELTDLGKFLEWKRQWEELGDRDSFRYFSRFNQAGSMDGENRSAPRSGRFSSAGPNIQQQPRAMREVFVPPAGCYWWSFDYSGLELHIAAALSQDPDMLRALTEECPDGICKHTPKHGDLHSMFQYKLLDITGSLMERPLVKTGNFEQLYGGGAGKLVEIVAKDRTYISFETASAIVEGHAQAFPRFHEWAAERRRVHKTLGYAETLFGRRRYIPELFSRDPERRSYGERAGVNHEIQGTAADIVKIAMRLVVPILRKYGAHMSMQVHDELDGWIPKTADTEGFKREMMEVMTSIPLPGIKLKVEGGANGLSWAEVH